MFEDISLQQILVWLATGGAVLAVSWIAEQWGVFQSLSPLQKRFAMWFSAGALGTGALWVTTNLSPEILVTIANYAKPFIVAFVMIFLQEGFHAKSKLLPKG
jgi:hypothetical protein